MKVFQNPAVNAVYLGYRLISPLVDPVKLGLGALRYPFFVRDYFKYSAMQGSEKVRFENLFPVLSDKTEATPFDSHYFYQDIWVAQHIFSSKVKTHVDVGSNIEFVGFLTSFARVKFIDIRPLEVSLTNFESIKGSILDLPFEDNSLSSVSCLHVAEHIGLGRYGDRLDPHGTKKACRELARVLAKGGKLYFSLPVGKPRLCFNAHRVHAPKQIVNYFKDLTLKEFSGINDKGEFIRNVDITELADSNYACGLFLFTKK